MKEKDKQLNISIHGKTVNVNISKNVNDESFGKDKLYFGLGKFELSNDALIEEMKDKFLKFNGHLDSQEISLKTSR